MQILRHLDETINMDGMDSEAIAETPQHQHTRININILASNPSSIFWIQKLMLKILDHLIKDLIISNFRVEVNTTWKL